MSNGSGSITNGSGLAVARHTTKLPVDVSILGGIIRGCTPLYQSNPEYNDAESTAKVRISIENGMFETILEGTSSVHSENLTGFISGDCYTYDPDSAYLAEGCVSIENDAGEYEVFTGEFCVTADGQEIDREIPLQMDVNEASGKKRVQLSIPDVQFGPYTWSVTDDEVASLDSVSGNDVALTAKKTGKVTVTASSELFDG